MKIRAEFLYRYVCPFVAGGLVSGATLVDDTVMTALMVTGAALLLLASLSFNSRMIERIRSKRIGSR